MAVGFCAINSAARSGRWRWRRWQWLLHGPRRWRRRGQRFWRCSLGRRRGWQRPWCLRWSLRLSHGWRRRGWPLGLHCWRRRWRGQWLLGHRLRRWWQSYLLLRRGGIGLINGCGGRWWRDRLWLRSSVGLVSGCGGRWWRDRLLLRGSICRVSGCSGRRRGNVLWRCDRRRWRDGLRRLCRVCLIGLHWGRWRRDRRGDRGRRWCLWFWRPRLGAVNLLLAGVAVECLCEIVKR